MWYECQFNKKTLHPREKTTLYWSRVFALMLPTQNLLLAYCKIFLKRHEEYKFSDFSIPLYQKKKEENSPPSYMYNVSLHVQCTLSSGVGNPKYF